LNDYELNDGVNVERCIAEWQGFTEIAMLGEHEEWCVE
jgi:hypothetical protein